MSYDLRASISKVDQQLYELVSNFEFLPNINPINLEEEKKSFFASKYVNYTPSFRYSELSIDLFKFKRQLYNIPVEDIKDDGIRRMYQDVIQAFSSKIEMLSTRGTPVFLYNSLRYFGEPNEQDVANAEFLLHAPKLHDRADDIKMTVEQVYDLMRATAQEYNIDCKIELAENIAAQAMVINSRRTLLLNKNDKFTQSQANILAHHEIGVHMVTTYNAINQPLRIFEVGMPRNTLTQEGLALLSEFLSGVINLKRLREVALRIIAIRMMLKGNDFRKTFLYLFEEYKMDSNSAFGLCARVYRAGGFTKDFLYLRGFRDILQYYNQKKPLNNLLIGKTSVEYVDTISQMIDKNFIHAPQYITKAFIKPQIENQIIEYLVTGIK